MAHSYLMIGRSLTDWLNDVKFTLYDQISASPTKRTSPDDQAFEGVITPQQGVVQNSGCALTDGLGPHRYVNQASPSVSFIATKQYVYSKAFKLDRQLSRGRWYWMFRVGLFSLRAEHSAVGARSCAIASVLNYGLERRSDLGPKRLRSL